MAIIMRIKKNALKMQFYGCQIDLIIFTNKCIILSSYLQNYIPIQTTVHLIRIVHIKQKIKWWLNGKPSISGHILIRSDLLILMWGTISWLIIEGFYTPCIEGPRKVLYLCAQNKVIIYMLKLLSGAHESPLWILIHHWDSLIFLNTANSNTFRKMLNF